MKVSEIRTALGTLTTSLREAAQVIQECIVAAALHYESTGEAIGFTYVVGWSADSYRLSTSRIKSYVESVANVREKDGKYRKVSRRAKPIIDREALSTAWDQKAKSAPKPPKRHNVLKELERMADNWEEHGVTFEGEDVGEIVACFEAIESILFGHGILTEPATASEPAIADKPATASEPAIADKPAIA